MKRIDKAMHGMNMRYRKEKGKNQTIDPDGSRIGKRVPGSSDYGA